MRMESILAFSSSLTRRITSILSATVILLVCFYSYTKHYSYFKRRGLSGPLPLPLVGNLHSILLGDRTILERTWSERYGNFYGIFHGAQPRFVVSDPEVLRQICIKDFASMPNHGTSKFYNVYQRNFIVFAQDETWRRLRTVQSPAFNSGKIRKMFGTLEHCADDLVLQLIEQLNQTQAASVDLGEIYSSYTINAIAATAYSLHLSRKAETNRASPRGNLIRLAKSINKSSITKMFVSLLVPAWFLELVGFEMAPLKNYVALGESLRTILEQRLDGSKRFDDYLQLLVDARLDEQDKVQGTNCRESAVNSHNSRVRLTDDEIISGAVSLLEVGLETTATLLTNCTYALAFHPQVQEKLYETLKTIARLDPESGQLSFNYDELMSCEYLDAVTSEALRRLSPVLQIDRVVKEDYYIEKYGLQLLRGDKLMLALYSIMNNPEHWPEPHKFDPERFMGDNKKNIVPGSYCPFGLGPRQCSGMRFSLTEAKLALAKVLMNFKIRPVPGARFPPRFNRGIGLKTIKCPLVALSLRSRKSATTTWQQVLSYA